MDKIELQTRLKDFAIRIIKMVDSMPRTISADALARQIVRSGTSPSANYRAALLVRQGLPQQIKNGRRRT